jgi:CHAD domain-containing protein
MKTSRVIAERLREVEQHEGKLPEKSAVHEMRVAARRLRAGLRVFRLRGLDPPVKALQDALGEVRDYQVLTDWLRAHDESLARTGETRLKKAERALAGALESWRAQGMPALLDAAAHARGLPREKVQKVVRKGLRRLAERLEQARTRPTPRSLHRARIAVKQVRYLIEIGEDQLPSAVVGLLADLKSLQESLGQLHDADVRLGLVKGRPALLREQREAREQMAKIVAAQLARWRKQKVVERAAKRLA